MDSGGQTLTFHPAADLFPMQSAEVFADLKASIEQHGWDAHHPIVLCDGQILDGRNRYMACQELGVTPTYVQFVGDPYGKAWLENGSRRDLEPGQRAAIRMKVNLGSEEWQAQRRARVEEANQKRSEAAKEQIVQQPRTERGTVAKSEPGLLSRDKTPGRQNDPPAHVALAKQAGVSEATAGRVQALAGKRPDLLEAVAEGSMKLTEAMRQARKDEASGRRQEWPAGKYRVIYADPPWQYGNSGPIGESDHYGRVERHYPAMSLTELCALDVKALACDDAVLFLWVTSPLLEQAFQVITAWGFKYKSSFVWDKVRHNFGYYNSVRHEFLLVCTRGSCRPDSSKLIDSVQSIERGEHSEKPVEFRAMIDQLYSPAAGPRHDRIELFLRGAAAPGWDGWGNEAERVREVSASQD
jgi:N6-adenosine-specific RNA methylase IME4/ParB-like chromosome segregation protein Spo0J